MRSNPSFFKMVMGFILCTLLVPSFTELRARAVETSEKAQATGTRKAQPGKAVGKSSTGAGSEAAKDYRKLLADGLAARLQGRLDEASAMFQKARDLAPSAPEPLFELAVTEEWRQNLRLAGQMYGEVLNNHPHFRGALLGMARVERSQYHFDKATRIYNDLLAANPRDLEARNGLAWIALANKKVTAARSGFRSVLSEAPADEEAKIGLKQSENVWRYKLDTVGGYITNRNGSSESGGVNLQVALDAFHTVEFGTLYNSNELPSQLLTQQVFLPTVDTRIGYHYKVPLGVSYSLTYDYRYHKDLADEHWIEGTAGIYLTRNVQLFSGIRGAFGSPQWNNVLFRTGALVHLTDRLQGSVTGYYDNADAARLPNDIKVRDSYSFAGDLYYETPGNTFLNLGMGYNPTTDNVNLHARFELPVTLSHSIIASVERDSINEQYISSLGLRFRW